MECPFLDLLRENSDDCVYCTDGFCKDFDIGPGNGDAWCREKIEATSDSEAIKEIIIFAKRIAKALYDSKSSTALFFVQQAYPEELDTIAEYKSSEEILSNIITLCEFAEREI